METHPGKIADAKMMQLLGARDFDMLSNSSFPKVNMFQHHDYFSFQTLRTVLSVARVHVLVA